MKEHEVTVRFRKDFDNERELRTFVRDALNGNRSNSFAEDVEVLRE